jgi:hypothetical protein
MDCAMTTEQIIKALETYAKWDTISSEFSHERHIAWKGAQEIRSAPRGSMGSRRGRREAARDP